MATNSSIPAWEIPWTEEPGGLQSMGSQRVGHDCVANALCRVKALWDERIFEEDGLLCIAFYLIDFLLFTDKHLGNTF